VKSLSEMRSSLSHIILESFYLTIYDREFTPCGGSWKFL
jgi:hypothetical protein